MATPRLVTIRGEHLVNLDNYLHDPTYRLHWAERQGYDGTFAARHDEILQSLLDHPDQLVQVVTGLDDICNTASCPNRREQCEAPELLAKDQRVAQEYGVVIGREYKASELIELLAD